MRPSPSKTGYFIVEGVNSFATAYYFNYLLFLLRNEHGFGNLENLAVVAGVGLLYIGASWFGGRFGQRHGYFTSLRVGFGGMILAVSLGWIVPGLWTKLVGVALWSVAICFTWPMLEALVSEHEPADRLPNRVGLYNVVWAAAMGLAQLVGGWLFETLGPASLFWLPLAIHALQLLSTWPLKKAHDTWLAGAPPVKAAEIPHDTAVRPRYFLKLAWTANPLAYMAINTVIGVVPGIATNVGLSVAHAGALMSVWQHVRTLSFAVLWLWPGWHYRWGWFLGSYLLMLVSFATILLAHQPWLLVVAQIGFGWSTALLYYSSLYYAMDGSATHGEHGGTHEALIGIGICSGPAISAAALWLTGSPAAPAAAVSGILLAGAGLCWKMRNQEVRAGKLAERS
jgi:predicted MFS family arabinose efflux permease